MQVADTASVTRLALERPMLWMDVEFDTPTNGWNGEVDARGPSVRCPHEPGLGFDGDPPGAQSLTEFDFRMRFAGSSAIEAFEVAAEESASRSRWMAEAPLDRDEFGDRYLPLVP